MGLARQTVEDVERVFEAQAESQDLHGTGLVETALPDWTEAEHDHEGAATEPGETGRVEKQRSGPLTTEAPTLVRVTINARIHDKAALVAYANRQAQDCWGQSLDEVLTDVHQSDDEDTIAAVVFEALVGSNEGPNPGDYGIEIDDYVVEVLKPSNSSDCSLSP